MSPNKSVIEAYFKGMREQDRSTVLPLLAEDVEWVIPSQAVRLRGKSEFSENIGLPPGFSGVQSEIRRMTEEGQVVVAEGTVRFLRSSGPPTIYQYCDVFEFEDGKVRKLSTHTSEVKEPL